MKTKISHLEAINLASSTEAVTYYICGVCIQTVKNETILVASNGHFLYRITSPLEGKAIPEQVIMGNDSIKQLVLFRKQMELKIGNKLLADDIDLCVNEDGHIIVTSICTGDTLDMNPVDGTFPDYTRVIPEINTEDAYRELMTFNPAYLATLDKLAKKINGKDISGVCMYTQGDNGSPSYFTLGVTGDSQGLKVDGVIMPRRM